MRLSSSRAILLPKCSTCNGSTTPLPAENLSTITTKEAKHHVVMLPFMAQGHIIPFLQLAKIHFMEASEHLEPHFECLICHITQEDGGHLRLCITNNMFLGWMLDVGNMLVIPRIQFCTFGAYGTSIYYTIYTHLPYTKTNAEEFLLLDMQHVTMDQSHLPLYLKMAIRSDPSILFMNRQIFRNMHSWGSICKTFEELEHSSLSHMRKSISIPVWAVGPILPSSFLSSSTSYTTVDSKFLLRGKQAEAK